MIKSLYAFVKSVVSIYKLSEKPLPNQAKKKKSNLSPPAEDEQYNLPAGGDKASLNEEN